MEVDEATRSWQKISFGMYNTLISVVNGSIEFDTAVLKNNKFGAN